MPCYMRIKPTHTESDVRTEYLCVCEIQDIFFYEAGREREGEIGAYDNYIVARYVLIVVLAGAGMSRYYLSTKAEKTRAKDQVSLLLSLINRPIFTYFASSHIDDNGSEDSYRLGAWKNQD